jgi:hypothetical protein
LLIIIANYDLHLAQSYRLQLDIGDQEEDRTKTLNYGIKAGVSSSKQQYFSGEHDRVLEELEEM